MGIRHSTLSASLVVGGLALAGCGHDYNYGYYSADPSGVYEGSLTDTVTQQATPVVGVIDENGDGRMMAQNGIYYAMGVNTSGNNVFGPVLAFPGNGSTVSGSLNGQLLNQGAVLNATITGTGADPLALVWNYDNVYTVPSSLPTLQGMWTYTSSSFTLNLSIGANGAFTGTDSNACTYSGNFSLVDPQFDAYTETFTQTCGSTGISFFGLSYFIPAASSSSATPAMINFLADDDNGHFVSAEVQYTGP